ncbi:hypothetical protein CYMTET_30731 [Cymbomonas tetramitiformis]|uniref:Uncharacterized protein n=1 Tax=Cymbomonas tetramitiformis TaxID=36881 RepID=A0AAE0FIH4_9CHLO|nr:hypothetical protein CYMTET_30731 [Cymbomonas tetramitiformis]
MYRQRAIQELAKAQLTNDRAIENKPLSEMTDEEIEERLALRKAQKADREVAAIAAADSLMTPTPPQRPSSPTSSNKSGGGGILAGLLGKKLKSYPGGFFRGNFRITMPPKPAAKRQRTEEPDWLAWAIDTDKKESDEDHYHPDQHGVVCKHGNTADLKEFVKEGPWCSEWWIWRRLGGLVSYFKTREDNLRTELSDREKVKIDVDAEAMRSAYLLEPGRLTELDVRYILHFKELLENKFVVIDKNRICIEYPYPAEPTVIPDMFVEK